ncbi:MAG: flagellar filament outer layer protein FlaA [Herpetosiphon sp.]
MPAVITNHTAVGSLAPRASSATSSRRNILQRLLGILIIAGVALLPFPAIHAAPGQSVTASVFGLNSHVASRYPRFETLDQPANVLKQLGGGWVREDVQWHRVQPSPGKWDWSWYDRVFALHQRNGLHTIGVIGPAVGWATNEPGIAPSAVSFYGPDPDKYAAFAQAVAARYKGQVDAWEIWNEPEHPIHWRPAPNPAAYAQLLTKASAAIRSVDNHAVILSGGITPFDPSWLTALGTSGAWNSFDAISVHPYVDPFSPEDAQIGAAGITAVQTLVAHFGAKPIWATEFGWGTGPCERDQAGRTDEDRQANYLARGAVMLRSAGAEHVLWYNFKDQDRPCYGLFRGASGATDYAQPKPAATALRVLSEQVGGGAPLGDQDLMPRQIVLPFEDAGGWAAPYPGGKPPIGVSTEHVHSGRSAGVITYQFTTPNNDYVAFERAAATPLPAGTTRLGLWVYGDGSGHILQIQLTDSKNETLQYRLGFIGLPGWQFLQTSITGPVEDGNRITRGGTGRLDGAVRIKALVVAPHPDTATGTGKIFVDDLTAFQGPEVYVSRFESAGGVVDVAWSPAGATIEIPSSSSTATVVDRDGVSRTISAQNGKLSLNLGAAPIYLHHIPAAAAPPPPPLPTGDAPPPYDNHFADSAIQQVWERTDLPISAGKLQQPRSWLWGPQPRTAAHHEPYRESPGGSRVVQYFDKSRMEINNPATSLVSNGLLVVEMISGRLQVGDDTFAPGAPADQAVAGDPIESNGDAPTYASFRGVAFPINHDPAPTRLGQAVTALLHRDGTVGNNGDLANYHVTISSYDQSLGHNVPQVFETFFKQHGLVYDHGYSDGQLFDSIFAMGLPISEPFWARVQVGGVARDVLMQAFERRVLTYTPENPAGFQVEMGNVGQHYLRWRYGR